MRKIYFVIAALAILAGIFLFLNSGATDSSRPQLNKVFENDNVISELSQQAVNRASVYAIKVTAANIDAATTSDINRLSEYYKNRFGKTLKAPSSSKDPSGPVE